MSTCIKTGAILNIDEKDWFTEIDLTDNHILYGDVHLIGHCCVIHFPKQLDGEWSQTRHGEIALPEMSRQYMMRTSKPYSFLVVPVTCVKLDPDALHEMDRARYYEAAHQYRKGIAP